MVVLLATHVNTRLPGSVRPGEENGRKWLRSAADETARVRVETRLYFTELFLFLKAAHEATLHPRCLARCLEEADIAANILARSSANRVSEKVLL